METDEQSQAAERSTGSSGDRESLFRGAVRALAGFVGRSVQSLRTRLAPAGTRPRTDGGTALPVPDNSWNSGVPEADEPEPRPVRRGDHLRSTERAGTVRVFDPNEEEAYIVSDTYRQIER
jgi:hypothetical protein